VGQSNLSTSSPRARGPITISVQIEQRSLGTVLKRRAAAFGSLRSQGRHHDDLRCFPIQISNSQFQTCLRDLATLSARVVRAAFAPEIRGRRECRAPDAPAASRVEKNTRVSHHGHAGSPGIPRAMVLTVSFVLSPVTGLVCHRHRRSLLRRLERQRRGVRTTRLRRPLSRCSSPASKRPPHPASRS
jgi:hypothetical protein